MSEKPRIGNPLLRRRQIEERNRREFENDNDKKEHPANLRVVAVRLSKQLGGKVEWDNSIVWKNESGMERRGRFTLKEEPMHRNEEEEQATESTLLEESDNMHNLDLVE